MKTGCQALLAVAFALGCGHPPPVLRPTNDAMQAAIDPSLPLVELPDMDLGKPQPRADVVRSYPPLGSPVPWSSFGVRVRAVRPPDAKGKPIPATLAVFRRSAKNKLVAQADCFLKPTLSADGRSVTYEGTCPRPIRNGSAILQVRIMGDAYLIRSVEVR